MRLGRFSSILVLLFNFNFINLNAEDKILSGPIINLEELEPSFENLELEKDTEYSIKSGLKNRKMKLLKQETFNFINLTGLDKITAKTKDIKINLGETIKFGLLEIKALKCGLTTSEQKTESVAYIQVKDISENRNEKVFIFNGWTFSSNPSVAPFDHAVYDIWLVSCGKA